MKVKTKVLFYASVKDKELFNIQQFYVNDIELLRRCGFHVELSNRILDFVNPLN